MESTRLRHRFPVLPRIEDLEQSHEWNGLTCEIKNLERLQSVERPRWRRSMMNQVENSSRGARAIQRRSMPEAVKPDLVYVRMTNSENVRSTRDEMGAATRHRDSCSIPGPEVVDPRTWKPRTEFERNYFGVTENLGTKSSPSGEAIGKMRENRSSLKRDDFKVTSLQEEAKSPFSGYYRNPDEIGNDFDVNDKSSSTGYGEDNWPETTGTSGSSYHYESPRIPEIRHNARENSEDDGIIRRSVTRNDSKEIGKPVNEKIELPAHRYIHEIDDSEYRGSRERLHEIFEHNRLLRRQFFANMPGDTDHPSLNDTIKKKNDRQGRCNLEENNSLRETISNDVSTMRNRLDFQKNPAISGFGSTETLTSQSNQSGASSNGRKSRTDFGNSPEPPEDSRIYGKIGSVNTTIDFARSKNDLTPDNLDLQRTDFTCDFLPVPSKSSIEYRSNSSDDINETDFYNDSQDSRRMPRGILKESTIDGSTDFSLNHSISKNRHRTDSLDSDRKFFATYVNVDDFAQSSLNVASARAIGMKRSRRAKIVPPPLDLTTIDRKWDDRWNEERDFLKNYTIEVTPLRDYEKPAKAILTVLSDDCSPTTNKSTNFLNKENSNLLRGSKSLMELSSNLSRSPSSSLKKNEKIGSSNIRRKNLDNCFSATIEDLRSPQLVNDFSNSLNDLIDRVDNDQPNRRSLRLSQKIKDPEDLEELRKYSSPDSVQRQSEISSTSTGNGTTLPLVYGPIPYSQ